MSKIRYSTYKLPKSEAKRISRKISLNISKPYNFLEWIDRRWNYVEHMIYSTPFVFEDVKHDKFGFTVLCGMYQYNWGRATHYYVEPGVLEFSKSAVRSIMPGKCSDFPTGTACDNALSKYCDYEVMFFSFSSRG